MRSLSLLVLMSSCLTVPAEEPDPTPKCDGVLQDEEGGEIDGSFDKDNDGFKDRDAPGCAEVYGLLDCNDDNPNIRPDAGETLCNGIDDDCNEETPDSFDNDGDGSSLCEDCDDTDERVWPGNTEICWDNVDNDCDTIIDNACGEDYNGNFQITPGPVYTCALGVMDIDFDELAVIYSPPYATMYNVGGVQPGSMDGTIDNYGYFYLEKEVILGTPAACDEYYRLFGTFTDADTFEGTLQALYLGFCLNCAFQEWTFTGTRVPSTY